MFSAIGLSSSYICVDLVLMTIHFLYFLFPGNEDVKLATLSAVASWAARSADTIQADLVSFISSGLKEKEALRRGHLRCLRVMCKNSETILQVI